MSTTPELTAAVHIEADPEAVFPYLTDPALLTRWLGVDAALDPRPGGEFSVDFADTAARGTYLSVQPPSSVVFTWGVPGNAELPVGSTTVEVTLEPVDGGTLVTLVHRGLTPEDRAGHAAGWRDCLARLAEAAGRPAGRR